MESTHNEIFEELIRDHLSHLEFDPVVSFFIEKSLPQLNRSTELREAILRDPYYRDLILRVGRKRKRGDSEFDLIQCIRLIGKRETRNQICAGWLIRNRSVTLENEYYRPKQIIPYTIRLEDFLETNRFAYREKTFRSGLIYDWILQTLENKSQIDALDAEFIRFGRLSSIAYHLAAMPKKFFLQDYTFASVMILGAASAFQRIHFLKSRRKKRWNLSRKTLRMVGRLESTELIEREILGLSTAEIAGLFAQFIPGYSRVESSLTFHCRPYQLSQNPRQKKLAMILHLIGKLSNVQHSAEINPRSLPLTDQESKILRGLEIEEEDFYKEARAGFKAAPTTHKILK